MAQAGLTAPLYEVFDVWADKVVGKATPETGYTAKALRELGGSATFLFLPHGTPPPNGW